MSLLSLPSTLTATQDPSLLPFLAASLWLFSPPGMGPFLFIPALGLVCLDCLFLLRLSPLAVAPFLLPRVVLRLALRASFSLLQLPCSLFAPGEAPLPSCPNCHLSRGSLAVSPVDISSDYLGQLFLWHHHHRRVHA